MDLTLNEEQQMLRSTARQFLEKACPKSLARELLLSSDGHSPELWNQIVELGWLGLPFPEKYGGFGLAFLDLAVVLEEIGRAVLPSPFCATVLLGGYPILDGGSEAQKASLLPRVARGELVFTMALLEASTAYDPEDVNLVAKDDGDSYVLNGAKLFVPYAQIADTILTVVRTEHSSGLSILLVDRKTPGVETTLLKPVDDSKLCEVTFEAVRVPRANILGDVSGARPVVDKALSRCAISECLQMVGTSQLALELSIEHAKNRIQFGQPVGAFQAVQHHCANMSTDLDGARLLSYEAAWMLSEGVQCAREVAIAKGWVSGAVQRVVSRAHQVLGGVGFVSEHDLTLCFKRVAAGAAAYGGTTYHYRNLGQLFGPDGR